MGDPALPPPSTAIPLQPPCVGKCEPNHRYSVHSTRLWRPSGAQRMEDSAELGTNACIRWLDCREPQRRFQGAIPSSSSQNIIRTHLRSHESNTGRAGGVAEYSWPVTRVHFWSLPAGDCSAGSSGRAARRRRCTPIRRRHVSFTDANVRERGFDNKETCCRRNRDLTGSIGEDFSGVVWPWMRSAIMNESRRACATSDHNVCQEFSETFHPVIMFGV